LRQEGKAQATARRLGLASRALVEKGRGVRSREDRKLREENCIQQEYKACMTAQQPSRPQAGGGASGRKQRRSITSIVICAVTATDWVAYI
jgi:hypothetical protein